MYYPRENILFREVAEEIGNDGRIYVVIINFSKELQAVSHGILIEKLDKTSIDRRDVFLVKDF